MAPAPATIRVRANRRGQWEVALLGSAPVACSTFREAREAAHRAAEGQGPCMVIVRDAYHRVLEREIIEESAALIAS